MTYTDGDYELAADFCPSTADELKRYCEDTGLSLDTAVQHSNVGMI